MANELKPCPHCGGKAYVTMKKNGYKVVCETDGCVNYAPYCGNCKHYPICGLAHDEEFEDDWCEEYEQK